MNEHTKLEGVGLNVSFSGGCLRRRAIHEGFGLLMQWHVGVSLFATC